MCHTCSATAWQWEQLSWSKRPVWERLGNLCCFLGEKLPWSTGASWVVARCIPERSHPCPPFPRLSGSTNAAVGESQSQVSFESCFCQSNVVTLWGNNLHQSWGDMEILCLASEPLSCSWPLCLWWCSCTMKLAEQFTFPHECSSSPSSGACVDVGLLQLVVLAAPQFL